MLFSTPNKSQDMNAHDMEIFRKEKKAYSVKRKNTTEFLDCQGFSEVDQGNFFCEKKKSDAARVV